MKLEIQRIDTPNGIIAILGKLHMRRTTDNIQETIFRQIQDTKFGLAYYDSTGCSTVGTDNSLIESAKMDSLKLRVEELFVLFVEHTNPKSFLHDLKKVVEIVELYCATSESVEVVITGNRNARSVMGLADDYSRISSIISI